MLNGLFELNSHLLPQTTQSILSSYWVSKQYFIQKWSLQCWTLWSNNRRLHKEQKHLPRTGCIWDEQRLGIGYPIKCIESESWLIDENWMFPISALQYQIGFPFPHLTRQSGGISNADFPKLICPCAWKPRGNMSSSFKGYVGYIEKVRASVQVILVSFQKIQVRSQKKP